VEVRAYDAAMRTLVFLASLCLMVGCDDDTGTTQKTPDLSVGKGDLAFSSQCGFPGDQPIDSTGVGKFCMTLSDCMGNAASTVCSTIGSDTTHFCTQVCTNMPAGFCGANAVCICDGPGRCACVPKKCHPPDGGI
jgi:hypothetical protein